MIKPIRSFILCTIFATSALLTTPLQAQNNPKPLQRDTPTLRQRLALSKDQQAQFRAIVEDKKAQLNAVHADTSLSPSERKQKIKAIHVGAETKIRAMLNENQLAEYDQIKQERREQAIRKRQTALPPTTQPPQ